MFVPGSIPGDVSGMSKVSTGHSILIQNYFKTINFKI